MRSVPNRSKVRKLFLYGKWTDVLKSSDIKCRRVFNHHFCPTINEFMFDFFSAYDEYMSANANRVLTYVATAMASLMW